MMSLAHFAADTLQMTLYSIKDQLQAHEVHPMRLGPWTLDLSVEVTSDLFSATVWGFWVTLARSVPLYLMVAEKENRLFVLDPEALASCPQEAQTVSGRVLEMQPAIRGMFRWSSGAWVQEPLHEEGHARTELDGAEVRQTNDAPKSRRK